uniref:Nuclear pore complex protein NUP43 n=1 Tax=Ananas comosus var. bracteatus TaxID=296719 RepID=A0A6V7PEV3_ANACO|nr:unnamed protein product [Ananas comosus var. bracteatus]
MIEAGFTFLFSLAEKEQLLSDRREFKDNLLKRFALMKQRKIGVVCPCSSGGVPEEDSAAGRGNVTGMVHSIDIHPSRKHICIVGGSSGTVFAWDLRWQQQLILLSGVGLNGTDQPVSESEVWEVQYDSYTQSSGITSAPSTKILPVMVCSEDGILAVLEHALMCKLALNWTRKAPSILFV